MIRLWASGDGLGIKLVWRRPVPFSSPCRSETDLCGKALRQAGMKRRPWPGSRGTASGLPGALHRSEIYFNTNGLTNIPGRR
jgi:hypothetical protein